MKGVIIVKKTIIIEKIKRPSCLWPESLWLENKKNSKIGKKLKRGKIIKIKNSLSE